MTAIRTVRARQILDSRGNPTVEVEVELVVGRASAARRCPRGRRPARTRPSSCATATRPEGARVCCGRRAREHEHGVGALAGIDAADQRAVDGRSSSSTDSENKGKLGANAILGASLAVARAAAVEAGLPLYRYVGGAEAHVCRCR